jgi:hypothetical protein
LILGVNEGNSCNKPSGDAGGHELFMAVDFVIDSNMVQVLEKS